MPINLHSIDGQNKLRGRISKNVAKIATNWLKMSRAAAFGQSLGGHNLVIFYIYKVFSVHVLYALSNRWVLRCILKVGRVLHSFNDDDKPFHSLGAYLWNALSPKDEFTGG